MDILWTIALGQWLAWGYPVDATATLMCRLDGNDQAHIVEFAQRRDFAGTPSLVATLGHVYQRAQPSHGMLIPEFGIMAYFSGWPGVALG